MLNIRINRFNIAENGADLEFLSYDPAAENVNGQIETSAVEGQPITKTARFKKGHKRAWYVHFLHFTLSI